MALCFVEKSPIPYFAMRFIQTRPGPRLQRKSGMAQKEQVREKSKRNLALAF